MKYKLGFDTWSGEEKATIKKRKFYPLETTQWAKML